MKNSRMSLWHFLAILTIIVWGASFVSTKVLLNAGFLPTQVYLLRFLLAYLILLGLSHQKFYAGNWKDELLLACCGLTAGSIYFIAENTALGLSYVSNVSLIVCANPLFIMIATGIFFAGERLNKRQITGSLITLCGMILVVLNGKFILKVSPVGDLLAFVAAIVWTVYSLIVRPLSLRYPTLYITRKIFFYGSLTSIPVLFATGADIPWRAFQNPIVAGNFLFLGIIASLFGYIVWNKVLKMIGTVLASNYIYAVPLVSILCSVIFLRERMTLVAILGAALILCGMLLAETKKK
ncbi:MAG: DMT family transporter [Hallerella porci]|uniref:Drug/metabolite transporter (DMT)-like permease n=1 Tax=Hallerella porci TaxID=1945871 RepID=A0ABX5LQ60_9BACT|nr:MULTISPECIES: DMT family transporter [Hallerella]MCI5599713.1 DMT family transporter [Hallerella sp.]MDY3922414.1 DMT family transporter [Hallerella porci]PWK95170.1 drug/metabolite transporter (DMT)-like permease [Hallerella porci]